MSNYNSKNTKVLATYKQTAENTRMLLLHTFSDGRLEYIIGSYFEVETNLGDPYDKDSPAFVDNYSWDWGHYFNDIVDAVDYWKREVLPNYDENTCPHCGCEGELQLESTDDYDTDKSYWYRCDSCGRLSKQSFTLIENVPVEG